MKSDFKLNLSELSEQLATYHRSRNELKKLYLNERLEDSLNSYSRELQSSLNYLAQKNGTTILRRMKSDGEQ